MEKREMEERKVVMCFLEYNGKILIARRSPKVGTYPGKWAGISGYIEENESPYQTVLKEISEEAGLLAEDVELIKEGDLLSVPDKEINVLWRVHPYLFRTKTDKLKLNQEHEEPKWIKPEEIANYETLPKLPEVLKSVIE